jgi:hypothetical protein
MARRRIAVGVAVALLAACSSTASKAKQPEDDFLDKVEEACRSAVKDIQKLHAGDANAPSDLLDILSGTADDLNQLDAPKSISSAYDDFTSNIDAQVTQLQAIKTALAAGDTAGEQTAVDQLSVLRTDNDGFVNTLRISGCRGMTPRDGLTAAVDTTDTSTPDTSTPDSSTPDTSTPDTSTPDTPISIDTTPPETTATTPSTATADTILPDDLSATYTAPPGYTWTSFVPPDAGGLYRNHSIGSLVTYYAGAEMRSDADSSTATVYVVKLSVPFTPEFTAAYQYWEVVDQGEDVTTPGGLPVRQKIGAFTDTDCGVYVSGSTGVTICVFTGNDLLGLIDSWVATNPL